MKQQPNPQGSQHICSSKTHMFSAMRLSARWILTSLLVLALLHTTHCLSLRNPFSALSQILQRPDITLATQYADPGVHKSDTPGKVGSSSSNDAGQRHQVNGVVTLTDGKYDFTYRPIAGAAARSSCVPGHDAAEWNFMSRYDVA